MNRLQNAGRELPIRAGVIDLYAHPATRRPVARTPPYHGWGFHEDGCRSGAAAARSLGGIW